MLNVEENKIWEVIKMLWIITIIVGAIIGLLYGSGVEPYRRMHFLINIIVGIFGALVGVWFFFSVLNLFTASPAGNFWLTILWSLVGAVVVTAIADAISAAVIRSREKEEMRRRRSEPGVAHEYEEVEEDRKRRRKK